jgi:hypothetical protein
MKKSIEEIYNQIQKRQKESNEKKELEERAIFEQRERLRQNFLTDIKRYSSISTGKLSNAVTMQTIFEITFSSSELISFELRIQSLTNYKVVFPNGDIQSGSSGVTVEFTSVLVTPGLMTIQVEDNLAINGISFISSGISQFEITNNIDNVVTINLQGNVITSFINGGFSPTSLVNLELANNRLPVSQVNSIISWIFTGGLSDGILSLDGQTPPATPSGQAALDRIDLVVNSNWTIPID